MDIQEFNNPEKKSAWVSLGVGLTGMVLVFMPSLLGIDGMGGGYALSFLAGFIAITALVAMLMFFKRAGELEKMVLGDDCLVHWRYLPGEWQDYSAAEYQRQVLYNRSQWITVAIIALAIGLFFWIFAPDGGGAVLVAMLGLVVLLGIVAFFAPRAIKSRNDRRVGEVWINRRGIYMNGLYASWRTPGTRLDSVKLRLEGKPYLEFDLYTRARNAPLNELLRVPVPGGQEAAAQSVVDALEGRG